ncbi:uncharacterized protein LOC143275623 [Babylonia areolata]|uniref:uncharacterized protein LOC143275623 n=1 Tax=Babylonia areolata TaxID=304850 RepID=UPI003FD22FFB
MEKLIEDALNNESFGFRDTLEDCVFNKINSAKGGKGKGKKGCKKSSDDFDNDAIANRVAELLVPLLSSSLKIILEQSLKNILLTIVDAVTKQFNQDVEVLKKQNLLLQYKIDKQEQYSRRENVKIIGIPEQDNEDLEEEVSKVFQAAGCTIKPSEIAVVHRSGQRKTNSHNSTVSRGNAPAGRPVLVKFVSRRTKATLMEKRRALKETQEFKKVFINDDLTPLRSRLLHVAKRNEVVDRVSTTHDGRIRCVLKKTPGQTTNAKVVLIDNPDDLFHLGVDSVDFEALGLQHVVG